MNATTLDLPVWAEGQPDGEQSLRQLADAVAALWAAGTGVKLQPAAVALEGAHARIVLAEPWAPGGLEEAPEAALDSSDRPFGRRARDLAPLLETPVHELLGRPLTRVSARHQRDQGRIVVELSLAQA